MFNSLKKELEDILNNKEGELFNNIAARNLYMQLKGVDFNPDLLTPDMLLTQLLAEGEFSIDATKENKTKDRRIKRIKVSGVKNFPSSTEIFYTLSFSHKDEKPKSTVILGNNGIGKTSFYAALEYILLKKAFTADIRGIYVEDFITNVDTTSSNVRIKLEYNDGSISELNGLSEAKVLSLPAFFCSEWDVQEVERKGNLTDYIIQQLGLEPFDKLLKLLERTVNKYNNNCKTASIIKSNELIIQAESLMPRFAVLHNDVDHAIRILLRTSGCVGSIFNEKQIDISSIGILLDNLRTYRQLIEQELKEWDYILSGASFNIYSALLSKGSEIEYYCEGEIDEAELTKLILEYNREWENLVKLRINIADKIDLFEKESASENLAELIKSAAALQNEESIYAEEPLYKEALKNQKRWNEQIGNVKEVLYDRFEKVLHKVIEPIKTGFSKILNPYLEDDGVEVQTNYIEDKHRLSVSLKYIDSTKPVDPFSPRRFLNTFRFKLYTLGLKICLACAAKVIYNENWPIFIDDIFDSSDFNNRAHINFFIERIIDSYNLFMKKKEVSFPMQLIFFTQDDVIGASIYKGFETKKTPSLLCRLHHYESYNTKEEITAVHNGQFERILNVADIIEEI